MNILHLEKAIASSNGTSKLEIPLGKAMNFRYNILSTR